MQIEIRHVAEVIRALNEMFGKITDNLAHFLETGNRGLEYLAAKRLHGRLVGICARSTFDITTQQSSLELYLARRDPRPEDWKAVMHELEHMLRDVKELLEELKRERSDFVLDSAYERLIGVLRGEARVLETLTHLPAPANEDERASVQSLNRGYKTLLQRCHTAVAQLGEYVKSHPAHVAESQH